jgi:hypothetical protein
MITVSWDPEGIFLVDIVRSDQTNSHLYIRILQRLEKRFRRVGHESNYAEVLHHDSADHTRFFFNSGSNHKTRIDCSFPKLAPSHLNLFGTVRDAISVKRFGGDDSF